MGWGSLGAQAQIAVRLMLQGGPQYAAQLGAATKQTIALGRATFATGQAMRTASQRTWLQNQAIFTMRRYAFYATLAVTTLAIGLAKLGYSYLSTRDAAKAALGPIFSSTLALNKEIDRLFLLSKYSPFVLKDMTKSFAVMYPALHRAGLGVGEINQLLLSMTNFLSQSLRTTPQALNQISYAVQHMLYQGRLTGRLTQSLAAAGVPVPELLSRLGYAHTNLSSIARLNISPQNVIRALTEMGQSGIFANAARRQALKSLPGMFQVLKDSLSQLIGQFGEGAYNRFKGNMRELVGPGGFLDRLGKSKNATDAILMISKALTGSGLAGRGLLMLLDTLRLITRIFVTGVIPAFGLALASLVVFAPIIWPLNKALGFLADHIWIVKYALVPLAAWFIISHTAMVAFWLTSKLITIATFGNVRALKALTVMLITSTGRMKIMTTLKRLWIVLTKGEILVTTFYGTVATKQYTKIELAIMRARLAALRMSVAVRSSWLAMLGPIGLILAALALYIHYQEQIGNIAGGGGSVKPIGGKRNKDAPGTLLGVPLPHFSLSHPFGDWFGSEKKPKPLAVGSVNPVNTSALTGESAKTVTHQLVVDRKVLAEAVSRETQDRQARR